VLALHYYMIYRGTKQRLDSLLELLRMTPTIMWRTMFVVTMFQSVRTYDYFIQVGHHWDYILIAAVTYSPSLVVVVFY